MFKDGPGALDWVRERVLSGEAGTLAVAFWGIDAIEQLGLDNRPSAKRITVICNLMMGGTNPREVERLCKLPNLTVLQSDKLHGKVYRFEQSALVGSSNASANGLSFEGRELLGWHEAGLIAFDQEVLASTDNWLSRLGAYTISKEDLRNAKAAWQRRRQSEVLRRGIANRIMRWLEDGPGSFSDRLVYLVAYVEDGLSEGGEQASKQAISQYGKRIDWYENWADLPREGILVSFFVGTQGEIRRIDGLYERRPDLEPIGIINGRNRNKLELCFKIEGKKHLTREREMWQAVLTWFRTQPLHKQSKMGWNEKLGGGFIDLGQVAQAIKDGAIRA